MNKFNEAIDIDFYRVFFHHLWYPWDAHSEFSTQTWFSDHLENRLKMWVFLARSNK